MSGTTPGTPADDLPDKPSQAEGDVGDDDLSGESGSGESGSGESGSGEIGSGA